MYGNKDDLMDTQDYEDVSSPKGPVIALGTPVQLQIDGVSERLYGVLVGMIAGECLIIRGQFDSLEGQAIEGKKATVGYPHEGAANTFASEWMGAITTPVELAFVKYPEEIEVRELRAHERMECFLPAELIIRNETYAGTIQDISERGCKFILNISGGRESPEINEPERVTLLVHMPEAEERQEISGEARNVHFSAAFDAEEMHVGIQFLGEASEGLKRIAEDVSGRVFS